MSVWANVDVPAPDGEMAAIDHLERSLGDLPLTVRQVRELITRLEVCHFKLSRHYQHIVASIAGLQPAVDVARIGQWHPSHGPAANAGDRSGRSLAGQRYIDALRAWLGEAVPPGAVPHSGGEQIARRVSGWLGERSAEKSRMVRRLLARLCWQFGENGLAARQHALDLQIDSMDICHYAFPGHLERVLAGIGQGRPVEDFEGCGTFDADIRAFVAGEYARLREWLAGVPATDAPPLGPRDLVRTWLAASLAKTLKTHIRLDDPLPPLRTG